MNNPSSSVININAINNWNWLIIQLIKDKHKIRWNQTGKLITDPTLDFFNKRLNAQFLNKKFGKHFQKSKISKAWKIETFSIPKHKVVCGKHLRIEKTLFFKSKRPHNLETLKWIHTKWSTLSQTSLLLNDKRISSLSPKQWGSSYPKSSN